MKPLGKRYLVLLFWALPMVGRAWFPLYFLLILLSIPWGVLQDAYKRRVIKGNPAYSDSHVLVGLETIGVVLDLLDNLSLVQGLDCHLIIFNKDSDVSCAFILYRSSNFNQG